ncbi:MAG: NADH-quinone oxidoreductase subunit J [Phycisphaeraceae bacterium]|nr:NADH-quinone oxidoreductase subunit J [Phycisphaeraceae bacterium]
MNNTPPVVWILYAGSVLGALALYLIAPKPGPKLARLGGLLGAVTLGGVWLALARLLPDLGPDRAPFVYYYVFSAIAIVSAVRVITHVKPVYSALWFVMVVLASAGLLLTLDAPFMALAMVIIYAGAILVTYVFVIMLAADTGDSLNPDQSPEYERLAREPFAAIAAGFLLLAVLLSIPFSQPLVPNPKTASETDAKIIQSVLVQRPAQQLLKRLALDNANQVDLLAKDPSLNPQQLTNIERLGLDLFRSHPLGLELAGIILTVSLVGAVVLARQRINPNSDPH